MTFVSVCRSVSSVRIFQREQKNNCRRQSVTTSYTFRVANLNHTRGIGELKYYCQTRVQQNSYDGIKNAPGEENSNMVFFFQYEIFGIFYIVAENAPKFLFSKNDFRFFGNSMKCFLHKKFPTNGSIAPGPIKPAFPNFSERRTAQRPLSTGRGSYRYFRHFFSYKNRIFEDKQTIN